MGRAAGVGLLLGVLCAVSPGGACVAVAAAAAAALLARFGPAGERRFLVGLFLVGVVLRMTLSAGLDLLAWGLQGGKPFSTAQPSDSWGTATDRTRRPLHLFDSDDYSERGYALAEHARGRANPTQMAYVNTRYGWNAYLYAVGGFYYLFGFSPVSVKWMNAILGALLGPAVFLLGWICFRSRWVARGAAVATAFFPSLVLWSLSNMKEPLLTLVTLLALLLLTRLSRERRRARALVLGAGALALLLLHGSLRFPAYTATLAASWLLAVWIQTRQKRMWRALVLLALLAAGWGARLAVEKGIARAFGLHARYLAAEGVGYRILPDPYYTEEGRMQLTRGEMELSPGRLLAWSGKALFHYLAEPLPRRMESPRHLIFYPQMVFWYFMLGFALIGAAAGLLRHREGTLFLVLWLCLWLLLGAITNGNVGTVFRFRDMVTPVILLLGVLGAQTFLFGAPRQTEAVR